MKKTFVYLGLVSARDGGWFVKVGMTNHPEKRATQYQTHCPGGLSSMHASEVRSRPAAYAAEQRILRRLGALARTDRVGGEWVWMPGDLLESAFRFLLEEAGEPITIALPSGRNFNWK